MFLKALDVFLAFAGGVYLFFAGFAHLQEFLFHVDAEEAPVEEVGGYAGGAASGEGVQDPCSGDGGGLDGAGYYIEGLLGGVLAAGFLPGGYGGEGPDVAHLGAAVDLLHQFVVEVVRGLVVVSCPQDVFCGVGEVAAGEVRGWVGLDPGYAV